MSEKLEDVKISGDKLDAIFDAQTKFRKILGKKELLSKGMTLTKEDQRTDAIIDLMTDQQKGQRLYDLISAMQAELEELKETIQWKWWDKEAKEGRRFQFKTKKNGKPFDGKSNAKEEIADLQCFLGDMCACVEMDATELAQINLRKTQVNIDRQNNNYSSETKDGADSEQLWKEIKEQK